MISSRLNNLPLNSQPSSLNRFDVWDGDWALLEEYDSTGNRIESYLQGYHGLVKTQVANIYYYQDELGSTSHIASASGALLESYRYNLYGAPTYWNASGSQITASAYNVRDLFTGQRFVTEIGLYDDRNRFLSPDLGRFLQPDPIGFKGDSSNLYRYCGNNWANKSDPMGLDFSSQIDFVADFDWAPSVDPDAYGFTHGTVSISAAAVKTNSGYKVQLKDLNVRVKSYVRTTYRHSYDPMNPHKKPPDVFNRTKENIARSVRHESEGHAEHERKWYESQVKAERERFSREPAYESKEAAEKAVQERNNALQRALNGFEKQEQQQHPGEEFRQYREHGEPYEHEEAKTVEPPKESLKPEITPESSAKGQTQQD